MGRRKKPPVDWEGVQREYRLGKRLPAVAHAFDVPRTSIIRKANKEGWQRDLVGIVQVRTQEELLRGEGDSSPHVTPPKKSHAEADEQAMDSAVRENVAIVRGHRSLIRRSRERLLHYLEMLDAIGTSPDLVRAALAQDGQIDKATAKAIRDALNLHSHAQVLSSLTSTLGSLIKLERQAYNIGADDGEAKEDPWESVRRSIEGNSFRPGM